VNEHDDPEALDNERLEFLGDAVVDFIAGEMLFHQFPDVNEGDLTRFRSALVRTESLAQLATDCRVGEALRIGKGEDQGGGRLRVNNLCGAFEALIGALYLDQGATLLAAERAGVDAANEILWAEQARPQRAAPAAADDSLDLDTLTGFLRATFADEPDVSVAAANIVSRGMSKKTVLLELAGNRALPDVLVLRMDQSMTNYLGTAVADEYPPLALLWQHGARVAQPFAVEPTGEVRSYATGWSNHYPTTDGAVERSAAVEVSYMPAWCVPGRGYHDEHDATDDFEALGPGLRLSVDSWAHNFHEPEAVTGRSDATVVMDEAAVRCLVADLTEWLERPKAHPVEPTA
jgi:hypothetical protein